jgi:hypothetical protein
MTDFDQWVKNLGVPLEPNPRGDAKAIVTLFEALYDLIIDTRKQLENM